MDKGEGKRVIESEFGFRKIIMWWRPGGHVDNLSRV
jgi:hypothetical protein